MIGYNNQIMTKHVILPSIYRLSSLQLQNPITCFYLSNINNHNISYSIILDCIKIIDNLQRFESVHVAFRIVDRRDNSLKVF